MAATNDISNFCWVVVLPGWYRYSKGGGGGGGGAKCHRLRYLIFPVWEKNTLSVNFVVMYRKNPRYNEFVECIEREKQDSENFVEKHSLKFYFQFLNKLTDIQIKTWSI
jgi:hypothetical protein